MFPGRSSLLIACAGLSLLTGREAAAESRLAVSPTVLELSAENPVAVLTVTNSDDAPTTMQISTVAWIADGDAFREQATREILASPAVIEVPPNSSQTVRVGLTRPAPKTGAELSYRVIIREVPGPSTSAGAQLRFQMRLSLPVFVRPEVPITTDVRWSAIRTEEGKLRVSAHNAGTEHAKISSFRVESDANPSEPLGAIDKFFYVLPGQERFWEFAVDDKAAQTGLAVAWRTRARDGRTPLILASR